MNFPVLPLISFLGYLHEVNYVLSTTIVFFALLFAAASFIESATGGYKKKAARIGTWSMFIAIFIWIVGVAYPLVFVAAVFALYVLVYWVIWRGVIKNVIVAFSPDKPKAQK
jgi:hypothetical protein